MYFQSGCPSVHCQNLLHLSCPSSSPCVFSDILYIVSASRPEHHSFNLSPLWRCAFYCLPCDWVNSQNICQAFKSLHHVPVIGALKVQPWYIPVIKDKINQVSDYDTNRSDHSVLRDWRHRRTRKCWEWKSWNRREQEATGLPMPVLSFHLWQGAGTLWAP